jgi:glycosyltransferase involved in cell wall biosynthesis
VSGVLTSVETRIKLGIVANEFFDRDVGRIGGFGWAAARVARCFGEDPELGVDPVFLTGDLKVADRGAERIVHGIRLLGLDGGASEYAKRVRRERLDLLLLIDYRPGYRTAIYARRRTPVILWARDPRPPEDVARVSTLEIPGAPGAEPQGVSPIDCTSFARVVRRAWWWRRRVLVATTTPYLHAKVPGTYGIQPPEVFTLPNIIDVPSGPVQKSASPTVVFLGRLDPYKRPWIAVELARRFPEVTFFFLGQAHFRGPGAWVPIDLPSNVKLLGHTDGAEKEAVLAAAWVLVNTSIHEGLAVSFLEALASETPILSCQDSEGVASRFGVYVGRWDGAGLEGVSAFVSGLRCLLDSAPLRERLGAEGRQWVAATHTRSRFLDAFAELCRRAGLRPRFGRAVRV